MASSDEVQVEIIEPMRALFRVPFGIEDPERALTEYVRSLRRYSAAVLKAGWARMIEKYKRRDWPAIRDFVDQFDALQAEAAQLKAAAASADSTPDPWVSFCAKVLAFVKRDRRTFETFRDAGIRAIEGEFTLAFDTAAEAERITEEFGRELDALVGFHVRVEGPPPPSPTRKWTAKKWDNDMAYTGAA